MAKRFTDTNKYKKPFVRGLPGAYKLLWDFLYHDCDHAGIWIVDFDIAQVYLGADMPVSRRKALELFNQDEVRIVELDGGAKWFIPSFIEFQYGQLSEKNRAHFSVITMLKKYNLLTDDLQISFSNKPLPSPLQGVKDKDKEKDKDKDKDKEQPKGLPEIPFLEGSLVRAAWDEWDKYRREIRQKLTPTTIKQQLKFLGGRSDPEIIAIINQSIRNGWTGLFELKKQYSHDRKANKRTSDAVIEGGRDFGSL